MNDEIKNKISELMSRLPGATQLTALELNDIRFSGSKSAITPTVLKETNRPHSKELSE